MRLTNQDIPTSSMTKARWDSYLAAARERYDEIDRAEGFKLVLGEALAQAREALLRDERDWPMLVKAAIAHQQNTIINWRNHSKLTEWVNGNVSEARIALSGIWVEDERTPGDRVRSFDGSLLEGVFSRGAAGTRLNVASYFMMGIDPQRFPPYRRKPVPSRVSELGLSAVFRQRFQAGITNMLWISLTDYSKRRGDAAWMGRALGWMLNPSSGGLRKAPDLRLHPFGWGMP